MHNRCPYSPILNLIKFLRLHSLTIIEQSDRGLNRIGKSYLHLLEHNGSGCLLLLLLDRKRTTMESKVGIDFFDQFGEDAGFVVVGLVDRVGGTVEECILFAGVPVKIQVHE